MTRAEHSEVNELRRRLRPDLHQILERAVQLGFLGPMPIEEQIDHSLGFVSCVETVLGRPPHSVVDLGSGGGVPGLVLACCWPDCHLVLLDSNERRTTFLTSEVEGVFAGRGIEVRRSRAEEAGREPSLRGWFEVTTARSFGTPAVVAECGAPLLSPSGLLVVSEPPEDKDASRWPLEGLSALGLSSVETVRFDGRFGYQVLQKTQETPNRFPRRVGIPAKRPLF